MASITNSTRNSLNIKNEKDNKKHLQCKNVRSTIFKATINAKTRKNINEVTAAINLITSNNRNDFQVKRENPKLWNQKDHYEKKNKEQDTEVHVERPTAEQQILNMRTRDVPPILFSENTENMAKPKKDPILVSKKFKTAAKKPQSSAPKVEEFDDDNPFKLDFAGNDWKDTYKADEQIEENKLEYFKVKKNILKREFIKQKVDDAKSNKRQDTFGLPKFFKIEGESMSVRNSRQSSLHSFKMPVFERPVPDAIPVVSESKIQAHLIRTSQKPKNAMKIEDQFERRQKGVQDRFDKKAAKKKEKREMNAEQEQIDRENFGINLGMKEFIECPVSARKNSLHKSRDKLQPVYQSKLYPRTMRGVEYLKRTMNQKNRNIKHYANVKTEFYESIGKDKIYKEKDLDVDEISLSAEPVSDRSTDDEDGLSVGPKNSTKYQLRGFQSHLNREPRGLVGPKTKLALNNVQQTCATRDEWLNEIVPKSNHPAVFTNCPSTVIRKLAPADESYSILKKPACKPNPVEISPILEMIQNLQESQSQLLIKQKKPTFIKPKKDKIRKFNLTGYIHGTADKNKGQDSQPKKIELMGLDKMGFPLELIERLNHDFDKRQKNIKNSHKVRLKAINAPIDSSSDDEPAQMIKDVEDNESASDKDWIPEKDDNFSDNDENIPHIRDLNYLTNVKAPLLREPTIRHHPRRLRGRASLVIDEAEILPRLLKVDSDIMIRANMNCPKNEHSKIFETRHHHDHFDHSQHKTIKVKYVPRIPSDVGTHKKEISTLHENRKHSLSSSSIQSGSLQVAFHTRDSSSILNTTNKTKYREFIENKLFEFKNTIGTVHPINVDTKLFQEFEDELRSIRSCYSSESSSNATNFTNDSGSFILLQDTKVPLDYIIKSNVPYEKTDRTRIYTTNLEDLDSNPYYRTPYCGQRNLMRKIVQPKDKFFTSAVRAKHGIRKRLKVDLPKFNDEFFGPPGKKYPAYLVTEWDSFYQYDIRVRPSHKRFQPSREMTYTRRSLRQKFTTFYIKQSISEHSITQKLFEIYFKDFKSFELVCRNLFRYWQDTYYRRANKKMQDLEPMFNSTAILRKNEYKTLKSYVKLGSQIMFLEDVWIRRLQYQNFHYLIADVKWRHIYDWIHRDEETQSMENSKISVKERGIKNIRLREKDDPWAVKVFYETFYLQNFRELLFPFENVDECRVAILDLKLRLFISLVDVHFKMWILTRAETEYNSFVKMSTDRLIQQEQHVNSQCTKQYSMENRVENLKELGDKLMETELVQSISWPLMRQINSLCEMVYEFFIPEDVRAELSINFSVKNKFEMISDLVLTSLEQIDQVPTEIRIRSELDVRVRNKFIMRQSERACFTENQIQYLLYGLRRNFEPPFIKPKRIGKLPRSYVPKRKPPPPKPQSPISERVKLFYKAFTDITVKDINLQNKDNLEILNSIQSGCVPFYFDHFLRLHHYVPIYDFKTDIETREGPEENRFKYKDVMPAVEKSMADWTRYKKLEEEHFIRKYWHLYIDKEEEH